MPDDLRWNGKRAVVTGACGFIGSHLVEALVRAGARTLALVLYDARGSRGWVDDLPDEIREQVEIVAGDVRDADMMRRMIQAGDTVFHLAALIGIPYSYDAPRSYLETNIGGTLNVLEAARETGAQRVLVTSTSEVYGTALRVPIAEDHPLQAQSPYAATKIGAEKLAESYWRSFETPVTVVRPFNTFGPRQSARAVIPTLLMQLLAGRETLNLGDPDTTRDFNYVEDTAAALIRLAMCDEAAGTVVNIGTGTEISIKDMALLAQRVVGREAHLRTDPERVRPEKSEVRRLCADATLLRALTGWSPPARMEEGLRRTADWMKERAGDGYEPDRYYV